MANSTIVYITTKGDGGLLVINEADEYQTDAYHKFMATSKRAPVPFTYGDPTNPITFHIVPMQDQKIKIPYDSFCVLLDNKGQDHVMTTNKPLLEDYVTQMNRVISRYISRGNPVKGGKRKTKKNRRMKKKKSRQRK